MVRPVTDDGSVVSLGQPRAVPQSPDQRVTAENPLFPGILDLTIYRGDSYEWQIVLQDPAGVLIDITNWQFHAEVRRSVDGLLLAGFTVLEAVTTAETRAVPIVPPGTPIPGTLWLRLPSDQSRLVENQSVWDLQAVEETGWVRTILRGIITVENDVTTGLIDYAVVR